MLERTIKQFVHKTSKGFPVLFLTGPRQIGKTSLLEAIREPERKYITLDDLQARQLARNDPKLFLQTYEPPIVIDEAQYAPELFPYIKIFADSAKKDGLFWLTGSQKFDLMKNIKESLAGRVAILDMLGLSYKEILEKPFESAPFLPSMDLLGANAQLKELSAYEVYKLIWNGSFPKLLTNLNTQRDVFYKEYLQTYIGCDVRDDLGINNETKFYNFICVCAARTGCLINYADIARDADINVKTVKIWLEALERAGLVKLLHPYHANINKRIIKTPKLYFLDTGLCSYLTKWDSPETLMAGAMSGAILETYVFAEILKSYWHNGLDCAIYFFRDSNQKEIDFIIEKNMTLYPIEVKKTANPKPEDVKHFKTLNEYKHMTLGTGILLCLYPNTISISKNIIAAPIWHI